MKKRKMFPQAKIKNNRSIWESFRVALIVHLGSTRFQSTLYYRRDYHSLIVVILRGRRRNSYNRFYM